MNDKSNQYNWVDIIEPPISASSPGLLDYIIFIVVFLILTIIIMKYFNVITKIKFYLIMYKIKNNHNSKAEIKKILRLLELDKPLNNQIGKTSKIKAECITRHRNILLKYYYSSRAIDNKELNKTLSAISSWL